MRRLAFVLTGLLVVVVTGLALSMIPSDHYIVLPDRARPTDPLVRIPGEESQDEEDVYMVDVRIGRASLFERLFPWTKEGADLLPERVVNPAGVSDRQRRQSSLNDMSRSQLIAITVALRELGREVDVNESGAEIVLVQPDSPADGVLEVGDVIVEAEGQEVESIQGLQRALSDVEPGQDVELTVQRGDERVQVTSGTQAAPDDPDRAVMGVQVQDALDFEFPVDIEIDAGNIGGPSAGLAFALDIMDELGDDIDRGRKIVATGELTLDGEVLPIGGVKQKAIGAREAGADIFLVPDANLEDAKKATDDLEIIPVSNIQEALSVLAAN
ncbi:MAG TPA: S16 family serine protease [Gaiellaceae bacterium]|nr:S16 family serine protease [Gaiellaceae bacterium]